MPKGLCICGKKNEDDASQLNRLELLQGCAVTGWSRALGKFYGQAERAISTGKLNASLRLHTQPIDVVVFHGPSEDFSSLGDLILGKVSRLYAFSAYPNRTSLPSHATGVTTGTQEVRSSRSSRTKDKPLQISYAHHR